MDANAQRFWLWSHPADWVAFAHCAVTPRGEAHDGVDEVLALVSEDPERPAIAGVDRAARAETELAMLPLLRDRFGSFAHWDPRQPEGSASGSLQGFGTFPGEVPRYATSAAAPPLALALDADDRLLLGFAERVEVFDLRDRHAPRALELPRTDPADPTSPLFVPHALACDGLATTWAQGITPGRYALDRVNRRLARIAGTPWPDRGGVVRDAGTFRPQPENADDARIELLPAALLREVSGVPAAAPLRPVAIACSSAGRLAVSAWGSDGELHLLVFDEPATAVKASLHAILAGAAHAHALAWVDEGQVALRLADLNEVLVFAVVTPKTDVASPAVWQAVGRRYPSADAAPGGFVASQDWPPHLPLQQAADAVGGDGHAPAAFSRALVPLAWRAHARTGTAAGRRIDTGQLDLAWHRVFIEAVIPPGCGILVELRAGDEAPADDAPTASASRWWPHWFGDASALQPPLATLPAETPQGSWLAARSELPHHGSLLGCAPVPGRVGLFGALVQRAGMQLRELRGRHLQLRVRLFGNGRATPQLAAVRVWGDRFSYLRRYLPELYRDDTVFDDEATGRATRHDFLERYLGLFESVLTPLEDAVADARVLSDPTTTPAPWLDWLAGWTGERFPARLPASQRRAWLIAAPTLRRLRGSRGALELALDIATDGAVGAGRILVLEDFRLRRTLATLLGIDLERADDPLLPGLVVSGNSFVGDTLLLGDADDAASRREFLALFGDAIESEAERATVASVYERTAHRATVLVHEGLSADLVEMVRNLANEVAPAHVLVKVMAAREPFMVGIASLVGVDSYLRRAMPPAIARVARSEVGRGDRIAGGGALDWRLDDSASLVGSDGAPRAVLQGQPIASRADRLLLDGSASEPPPDGAIARWRFTRLPPD